MASFFSPYSHEFVRLGACVPHVAVADPRQNADNVLDLLASGDKARIALMVFPELGHFGLCDRRSVVPGRGARRSGAAARSADLRQPRPLPGVCRRGAVAAPRDISTIAASSSIADGCSASCPRCICRITANFTSGGNFTSGEDIVGQSIEIAGHEAPFGRDLLFAAQGNAAFTFHVEICEDLWVPHPPSTDAALAGAEILLNLSASNITIGKAEMRRLLCASQSSRCIAAYAYSAAGAGESTTDLAWDGQAGIFELSDLLAETERFSPDPEMAVADVDLGRIRQERMRTNTFGDNARARRRQARPRSAPSRSSSPRPPNLSNCAGRSSASRMCRRTRRCCAENCYEAYNIQVQGLAQRLKATGLKKLVIGVSGGLELDPGADRLGAGDGSAGDAAQQCPRLHAPRLCDEQDDQGQCLAADAGARRHRRRDRHPAGGAADAEGHRARLGHRRSPLRRDLRERPGRVAHRLSVPAGEPQWRVWWSAPATSPSSASAGAPTGSAIRCRITTRMRRSPRP